MIRAGALDRRWQIQSRQEAQNAVGDNDVTWKTIATVWGSWNPMKGAEKIALQQFSETSVARIKMRYNPIITAQHRVKNIEFGQFEIIGEPEQRRREGETVLHVSRVAE